jgi:hypothetical protein
MNNKLIRAVICFQLIVVSISATDGSDANSASSFDLPAVVTGATHSDVTNITATKEIVPSGNKNSPDIKLTLTMPPTPAKLDIVLAMDTSGSMVQHFMDDDSGRTHIEWASDTIRTMIDQYKEARVSIVSWDDEDESGDTMTQFYNLSVPGERIIVVDTLEKLNKECKETDNTIYSVGVKRAVKVMDTYPPLDPHNAARIIIFVTGLSEFSAEPKNSSDEMNLSNQLENARRNRYYDGSRFDGYQIFPLHIGIDPSQFPWQYDNTSMILRATKIRNEPHRNESYLSKDITELEGEIHKILGDLKSKPIAQNVVVVDTLYPYLDYLGSENLGDVEVQIINSSDNSTTLIWNIGKMNNSAEWWARIHTRLNLSLPIEVSDGRTPVLYEIANTTPVSEVRYTWLTGFEGVLPFSEGEIRFDKAAYAK